MNVLITGGASGIGFALCDKLIRNGHYVYLCVHCENEIITTLEKMKNINYLDMISIMKLDITLEEDRNLIKKLDIDCLVNLAGIGYFGSLLNMNISDIRKNFEVNFFGTLELTKLYIKGRLNKNGIVLITSSLAGIFSIPFLGSYCSSKAALIAMATSLNSEVKKANLPIKVRLIEPGAYHTGFNQFMVLNKSIIDDDIFSFDMVSISDTLESQFTFIEKKKLNSVVNRMYEAIVSRNNKLVYRTPFLQSLCVKLYSLFYK